MIDINVIAINTMSEEEAEADIVFCVNESQYRAFCCPCRLVLGINSVEFNILDFGIDFERFFGCNPNQEKCIKTTSRPWQYEAYGQVVSVLPLVVNCGDLPIVLDSKINDYKVVGSYVYFDISRLEIVCL